MTCVLHCITYFFLPQYSLSIIKVSRVSFSQRASPLFQSERRDTRIFNPSKHRNKKITFPDAFLYNKKIKRSRRVLFKKKKKNWSSYNTRIQLRRQIPRDTFVCPKIFDIVRNNITKGGCTRASARHKVNREHNFTRGRGNRRGLWHEPALRSIDGRSRLSLLL